MKSVPSTEDKGVNVRRLFLMVAALGLVLSMLALAPSQADAIISCSPVIIDAGPPWRVARRPGRRSPRGGSIRHPRRFCVRTRSCM
jgi:hypothetical protein